MPGPGRGLLHASAPEGILDDVPDKGRAKGLLYRLGVKRTARVWGREFTLRDPGITPKQAWLLRNGRWERPEILLSLRHMDPALPLVEIGGGLGTTCCVLNRRLADPTQHVVLEMDPLACRIIERNKALNGARFDLVPAAVGYGASQQRMTRKDGPFDWANRLADDAVGQSVATTTLAAAVTQRAWSRFNLLMDIEGAEQAVFDNEGGFLREHVATLVFEVHPWIMGSQGAARFLHQVQSLGFRLLDLDGHAYALANDRFAKR